jgi:hypothetical protein
MTIIGRRAFVSIVADRKGTALPLAMIMLAVLASLTTAFIAMSATEPLIAANLKTGDQALALAEAGVERVRWALANPAAPASGLTSPLPAPVPAPYAGQLVAFGTGAYQATVTNGALATERNITVVGSVLRNGAALPDAPPIPQANLAAQRVVQLVVTVVCTGTCIFGNANPPGALTVGGSVQMSGNTTIDSSGSTCGPKTGVTITDVSAANGQTNTITTSGSASVTGTPNTSTMTNGQFQERSLTPSDLASLKALAQSNGTYIQPSSGSLSLTLSDGLTFIDTINGQAFENSTPGQPYSNFNQSTDASKLASVSVTGNNTGSGWLVVMGSLQMSGNTSYAGLIFTFNDLQATGNTHITGAIISQNAVDTIATVIDTETTGDSHVIYDCAAIANGSGSLASLISSVPPTYTSAVKPGTWKSCPVGSC